MSIPGAGNPLLLGGAGGYKIERSLRFNSADSAYLSRTPASAGNRKTWTWSGWVKKSGLNTDEWLFGCGDTASDTDLFLLGFQNNAIVCGTGTRVVLTTSSVYRDVSAWYHIILSVDTTNGTADFRQRLYVNGVEVTSFSTRSNLTLNQDTAINRAFLHHIGRREVAVYLNGYLADVHFIDGQALTPSSFGKPDANGIWQPKAYSGSYGTNGFQLKFADNSAATATTLGKDTSGNGNNWTPNNLTAVEANYSARTSLTGTIYPGAGGVSKIFDGTTATCGPDNGSYATFTPSAPIPINTSLRVRANVSSASVDANFQINGSPRSTVSLGFPVSVSIFNAASTWVTITSPPSSLTSLTFGWTGSWMAVSGIEIDGTVLVDSISDSVVDSPTNYGTDTGAGSEVRGNYCTLNPLAVGANISNAQGNLYALKTTTGWTSQHSTIGVSSGKYYFEGLVTGAIDSSGAQKQAMIGVANNAASLATYIGVDANGWSYNFDGLKINAGAGSAYGAAYTGGDIISVAIDLDNSKIWFAKNGTWQASGNPATGANAAYSNVTGTVMPAIGLGGLAAGNVSWDMNFGQRQWAYAAPAGFKALCTQNLPAPTITKPSTVMDVKLYDGNGSTQAVSGLGFSPDLVWGKNRNGTYSPTVQDTVRGAGKTILYTNQTIIENNFGEDWISAFNSDGFTMPNGYYNESARTYVAWCWDAGSSTVTNTSGTISSQVRANASAGFSVVTWTGTAASGTVGHGLGAKPNLIIARRRDGGANWCVYHISTGASVGLSLNSTSATFSNTTRFNGVEPTSSVFSVGTSGDINEGNDLAYCFAPVAGYSAFGSYTGNGSSDGSFVYTGFRPRWVMTKASSSTSNWIVFDTTRLGYNGANDYLLPNSSGGEGNDVDIDILSNGFKPRDGSGPTNVSGVTYIYAAFAEAPFALARAR